MFHSARLKLTLWYVLISFIITGIFSVLVYSVSRFELERGLQRQRISIEQANPPFGPNFIVRRPLDRGLMQELRNRLLFRILYIDLAIILATAMGGYILAGRTLKPIKQMVEEQDRFITDASHELRTPLTALRSELETSLLSTSLSSKEAKALIQSNLEEVIKLQELSDNLLELAQYQNRQTLLEDVSLKETLQEALKKIEPLAKKKKITINQSVSINSLKGNKHSLVELFIIILDNAVKYSPSHSTVTISATKKDHKAVIQIKDEGIGIDEKELPHIFDRFYRSDKSRTQTNVHGYGLGLAIAKQIVTAHNGRITAKSVISKGTVFTVSLPIK